MPGHEFKWISAWIGIACFRFFCSISAYHRSGYLNNMMVVDQKMKEKICDLVSSGKEGSRQQVRSIQEERSLKIGNDVEQQTITHRQQ